MRPTKILIWFVAGAWSILSFLASNDPLEVSTSIKAWFAIPWIQRVLISISNFAGNTFVLVFTFLLIGLYFGIKMKFNSSAGWRPVEMPWAYDLGEDMSTLRDRIVNILWEDNLPDLYAQINVTSVAAQSRGIAFPSSDHVGSDIKGLCPYLTQVSAHLKANQIAVARNTAKRLSGETLDMIS